LVSRTNGTGQTVTFARDAVGEVIEKRSGQQSTRFTYDAAGRLLSAIAPATEATYERDLLGRVTSEICNGRRLDSRYDLAGRRVGRRTPNGALSTWAYDVAGLPNTLTTAGQTLHFQYDAAGREVQRRLGTGAILDQQYDSAHRLISQRIWGAPAQPDPASQPRLLQQRTYSYRDDGNVTAIADTITGSRQFDLDRAGRITTVRGHNWTETYAYDAAGNLTHAAWPTDTGSTAIVPGPDDAIGDRDYSGTLILRAGRVHYEHDAQGRVVLKRHVDDLSGLPTEQVDLNQQRSTRDGRMRCGADPPTLD
jgi:YD repeat-containing protein